jgi:hypothetical protein
MLRLHPPQSAGTGEEKFLLVRETLLRNAWIPSCTERSSGDTSPIILERKTGAEFFPQQASEFFEQLFPVGAIADLPTTAKRDHPFRRS